MTQFPLFLCCEQLSFDTLIWKREKKKEMAATGSQMFSQWKESYGGSARRMDWRWRWRGMDEEREREGTRESANWHTILYPQDLFLPLFLFTLTRTHRGDIWSSHLHFHSRFLLGSFNHILFDLILFAVRRFIKIVHCSVRLFCNLRKEKNAFYGYLFLISDLFFFIIAHKAKWWFNFINNDGDIGRWMPLLTGRFGIFKYV